MIKLTKKCSIGAQLVAGTPLPPSYEDDFRKTFGDISNSLWNSLKNLMSYIWKYLKSKNLSDTQIAGIMGNMAQESMFDHNKRGKNYSGIVQMSNNAIWPAITKIYGNTLDGQLNYIADYALGNLNTNKKKDHLGYYYSGNIGYKSGNYVSNPHKNASDSAHSWGVNFERAITNGKLQEEAKRRNYATQIYNYYTNSSVKFKQGGKVQLKWFR